MSTKYFFEKPLTLEAFLKGLPKDIRSQGSSDDSKGCLQGTNLSGEPATLWWYAQNGVILHLERYGDHRPRKMLEVLAVAFGTQIRDELGAVLGVDDWFDFYSREESYDAIPRHETDPEPSTPAG